MGSAVQALRAPPQAPALPSPHLHLLLYLPLQLPPRLCCVAPLKQPPAAAGLAACQAVSQPPRPILAARHHFSLLPKAGKHCSCPAVAGRAKQRLFFAPSQAAGKEKPRGSFPGQRTRPFLRVGHRRLTPAWRPADEYIANINMHASVQILRTWACTCTLARCLVGQIPHGKISLVDANAQLQLCDQILRHVHLLQIRQMYCETG